MTLRRLVFTVLVISFTFSVVSVIADDKRSPPPKFTDADTKGIFFPSFKDAIRGKRPTLSALQKSAAAPAPTAGGSASGTNADKAGGGKWDALISPVSIEDEVKRVKLHFDGVVNAPGPFKSGGYQDARTDLSILALMFAIINDYGKDVRWKDQAAAARDLMARTALNCKAGSSQVYNEATARKNDLQDLVSGGGLAKRDAEKTNDWTMIVDRTPMMEYAEQLKESLKEITNKAADVKNNPERVRREAELLAVLGVVLTQEGMDDFEDDDYKLLSKKMTDAARNVVGALERDDTDGVRKAVGAVTQSCDACHEQYR